MVDLEQIVIAVRRALPKAEPHAAIPMLLTQLEFLDADDGADLIARIFKSSHPSVCRFGEEDLDLWPSSVADLAMAYVRSLPRDKYRILAMCDVANRLTLDERRVALDGILDATLPNEDFVAGKCISYFDSLTRLVRTLPNEWKEEWLALRVARFKSRDFISESIDRKAVGSLDESVLRRMWSEMNHDGNSDEIPREYFRIACNLPDDLKLIALARIRNASSQASRLHHLAEFDDELTDSEREEIVEILPNERTADDPRFQATHLEFKAMHLPKVSDDLRQRWLCKVLSFPDHYDRQRGLMVMLESLSGNDHTRAIEAIVASVIQEGRFYTSDTRWDLIPEDVFAPLLERLKEDVYGWSRNQIIDHLHTYRNRSLADECLLPMANNLASLDPNHCLEITSALTPWLAERTSGMAPKAIAELPVPIFREPANSLYVISRVIAKE